MKIIQEFKEFSIKGNMIDLAVGVIIGGAFGKIISSIVNDIIMPLVGLLVGGINFKDLKVIMSRHTDGSPAATWNYGNFIQSVIEFLIIAVAIFLFVKLINKFRRTEKAKSAPPRQELLLEEIRDLLKNQSK